ncbi:thymidylate kinase [Chlamydia muridarum str. Nigg]|uniref:Thymidylate kinase n=2 Tax=Chlamydia muridarum TaxID=83560 RepID=KTHY_CHLMU|nr:dTMP kinase [Chlamydia muridarum]Q9PKK5.1 RecName: Full=Thymidylate kinase; AltName: Full=dTMP kinase [Chlamydia muridarum str. Nigg]UFT31939.1 dTMP kinase [Chlamydia trachomatis]AAF39311.1 thymidylate kinase [Chlamydia muridarum str. Nigg]AHH22845.1 thymidylate kinase [Chlamydia muridarum str. Nigg3 CMUT3-5]AHH23770.1 thymidylate kinase [Chlamydia muridarum str. Nigg CM972]AID37981.1 thymidylate kinase [Chlamydia muridarum str. Nigg 2 MCR]
MFIVVEGGEGAGKTQFTQALSKRLMEEGKEVVLTREPGGSALGEQLRDLVLDVTQEISSYAELLLFLAARAQHIQEKILPALESGKTVICDRFHDSTIVYQGIAGGLGEAFVTDLCYRVVGDEPFLPDITFLLDLPEKEGLLRKTRQKNLDRFEQKPTSFHRAAREGFISLAERSPDRYKILDALLPTEVSVDQALLQIRALI